MLCGKEGALLRQRIGAGAETAAAVAGMLADIEPAPVVDRSNARGLERYNGVGRLRDIKRRRSQRKSRDESRKQNKMTRPGGQPGGSLGRRGVDEASRRTQL